MARIKWKKKSEIEQEQALKEQKKAEKEELKGKDKTKLSRKELDDLIIIMAEERGLL